MKVKTVGFSNFATRPMEGVAGSKIKMMGDHSNKPPPIGNNKSHY